MTENDIVPIVMDNGSGTLKAGFAGQDCPSKSFSSVIGRPKHQSVMANLHNGRDNFIGPEAQEMRSMLNLKYPMRHGMINDWDGMEKIWRHMLEHELKVDPEEHPILITEAPLNPHTHSAKIAEIMFESFNVPALLIQSTAPLSLYAQGLNTGLVVSSGDGVTSIVPVYEGYSIPHAIIRNNLGGRDITDFLIKLLGDRGYSFTTTAEREIARDIKEKLCCIAQDYDKEMMNTSSNKIRYQHPNGYDIEIGSDRYTCAEAIFQPNILAHDGMGIHQSIYQSICSSDIDIRKDLYSNIVICGGSTLFPGYADRLHKELFRLAPASTRINIHASSDRINSAWIGGSVLASLPQFWETLLLKADYDEMGASAIYQRLRASAI